MKKLFLLVIAFLAITQINAQGFNKWSIDLGAGVHKPVFPISSGYGTDTPDFWQANFGGRYMINEKFGLRLDFGLNNFTERNGGRPFDTDYYRGTLEGVINAGEILGFRDWSQRINVLIHGGVGLSTLQGNNPSTGKDRVENIVFGITPQIRLSDKVALFFDASAIGHFYQDISFDGNGRTSRRGVNGGIFNASIGLNIYLGKKEKHADWYTKSKVIAEKIKEDEKDITNEIQALENRLKAAEAKVSKLSNPANNYDKNTLISELDTRYSKKGNATGTSTSQVDFIKELLNKGYQNVYFDFGKSSIQNHSLEAVNYLTTYLKENSSVTAKITGYADELGSTSSNQRLSTKRAKRVYDVLIASGIAANRLSFEGKGEDASVDKNSEEARQLVRRVTFTVSK